MGNVDTVKGIGIYPQPTTSIPEKRHLKVMDELPANMITQLY